MTPGLYWPLVDRAGDARWLAVHAQQTTVVPEVLPVPPIKRSGGTSWCWLQIESSGRRCAKSTQKQMEVVRKTSFLLHTLWDSDSRLNSRAVTLMWIMCCSWVMKSISCVSSAIFKNRIKANWKCQVCPSNKGKYCVCTCLPIKNVKCIFYCGSL